MNVSPPVVRLARLVTLFFLIAVITFALYLTSATNIPVEFIYLLASCVIYCLVIYTTASAYAKRYIRRCVISLFVKSTES